MAGRDAGLARPFDGPYRPDPAADGQFRAEMAEGGGAITLGQASADTAERLARIDAIIARSAMVIAPLDDVIRLVRDVSDGLDQPHGQPLKATAAMRGDILIADEGAVENPVQQPSKAPETRAANLAAHRRAHRRAHRSGRPSNIDADPDLRAFILARLATHRFTRIRDDIAANFPPDRRTSPTAAQACPPCHAGGSATARP